MQYEDCLTIWTIKFREKFAKLDQMPMKLAIAKNAPNWIVGEWKITPDRICKMGPRNKSPTIRNYTGTGIRLILLVVGGRGPGEYLQ